MLTAIPTFSNRIWRERQYGLLRNTVAGKFVISPEDAGLPALPAIACAAADYDNDSKTDLAVAYADHVALYHNEGGKFRDVTDL